MKTWMFGIVLLLSNTAWAFDPFNISDIRLEGLQRISAGTVFNYLPVKVGDAFDEQASAQSIRALFKTGFFQDVRVARDNNVLVITLVERPSIASIKISGNKQIETEELMDSLKQVGMAEGRVFNQSLLDKVEQELRRQYFNNGRYGVKIKTGVEPLERNRVAISLDISEGKIAKIREINIIGNKVFSDEQLLDLLELGTPSFFSFYSSSDEYSKQKLNGDLETLTSFYLDQGYLNFNRNSTQVSISPDKKHIYITINITEGERFTIKDIKLAGNLVVPTEELRSLVEIKSGDVYSRKKVSETSSKIAERLGNEGYVFANINTVPDLDSKTKQVSLTFFVDPGKRVYVRRINIFGNTVTGDEVLRREMRQMEGGWFSTKNVNRSRTRLERLGFFKEVNVETPPVAGTTDQVDVNFTVAEKPSGNFLASVGYSQTGGLLLSTSIQEDNFLGTGKSVGFTFNNSDVNRNFRLSYTNPYYTLDGVSRGIVLSSRRVNAEEANLSDYSTEIDSISLNYGIPLTEHDRFRVSLGYENINLVTNDRSPLEVTDFVALNGEEFDTVNLGLTFTHDTRNRALFPDRGSLHSITAEIAVPGGDLEYYKLRSAHQWYIPLGRRFTLLLRGDLGYGDGYGDTESLPFYENFFAGGTRTVRGYDDNSLFSSRATVDSNNRPLGGRFRVVTSAELILPVPFAPDTRSLRLSAFVDAGNVFDGVGAFDEDELRASTGLSLIWISPLGPLSISAATPFNDQEGDDPRTVQFSLGGAF